MRMRRHIAMNALPKLDSAEAFARLSGSASLSVVHFEAPWAPQCGQVTDALLALAETAEARDAGARFYSCPAEDLPEVALQYKVEAVPTVVLLKGGKIVDRVDGVDVAKLAAAVKNHSLSRDDRPAADESLDDRLRKLVNRHRIMVFMKGDRRTPRCGFSRTLIQILQDAGEEYDTFDILTDEEVRQGLKKFSDWPTYPQVYVAGELIGGLDIIKEMLAAGELGAALKGQ